MNEPPNGDETPATAEELDVEAVMAEIRERARLAAIDDPPHAATLSPPNPTPDSEAASLSGADDALGRANTLFNQIHERHALVRSFYALDAESWSPMRERIAAAGGMALPPDPRTLKGRLKRWAARLGRILLGAHVSYNEQLGQWMDHVVQTEAALVETLNGLTPAVGRLASTNQKLHQQLRELTERHELAEQRARQQLTGLERRQEQLREHYEQVWTDIQTQVNQRYAQTQQQVAETQQQVAQQQQQAAVLGQHYEKIWTEIQDTANQRYAEIHQLAEGRWSEIQNELKRHHHAVYENIDRIREEVERAEPSVQPGRDELLKHLLTKGAGTEDFDFLAWEEYTRGAEDDIRRQQDHYTTFFIGHAPVLDIGCGRGEFLELLRAREIDALGIDLDASMVRLCQEKGLHAERADGLEHLAQQPDDSLGGLFAAQVVEHLTVTELSRLTREAFRAIKAGGPVVLETLNPSCLSIFSGAFYADPTHVKPVHPTALQFFLHQAGFVRNEVHYSMPTPDAEKLKLLTDDTKSDIAPTLNENFERLNSILYSCGHYAVVAWKPEA